MDSLLFIGRRQVLNGKLLANCGNNFKLKKFLSNVNQLRQASSNVEGKGGSDIKPDSRVVFSGIQPTGIPHVGNYFGAIQHWVKLQEQYSKVIYSVVDLHAITLPQDPGKLRKNIIEMVACLIACGIDPNKSILFQQSSVCHHAELGWILGCLTTMPKLQHLPQWKEKSEGLSDGLLGIFTYPVLQAADILLYKATDVPVGDDQVKHIELARHLAKKFNKDFGYTFPRPLPLVGSYKRVRSLRNPTSKMSKSEVDPRGRIELTDTQDEILDKCKKAVTDFTVEVSYQPAERPGVSNLIDIYSAFAGLTPEEVVTKCQGMDTLKFKTSVADVIIEHINPIRSEIIRIKNEPGFVEQVLKQGAEKARNIASKTYNDVRQKVGLV